MNNKETDHIKKISKHVEVLNHELGNVQTDVSILKTDLRWVKRVIWYLAGIGSLAVGKSVFLGGV